MPTPKNDRLSQLKNLLEKDPHDAFCMYGIAMEHAKYQRLEEAIAWFNQTIETDPSYSYAWYHKAKCQFSNGDTNSACETLREGIQNATDAGDHHAVEEMNELHKELQ